MEDTHLLKRRIKLMKQHKMIWSFRIIDHKRPMNTEATSRTWKCNRFRFSRKSPGALIGLNWYFKARIL